MRQYIPPGRGTKYHLWSGFEKKKRKKKAIRSRSSLSIYQCIGYKAEHNVKQYNRKASSKIQTMGNSRTYNHLTTLLKKYFKREREKKWGGGQMEGRPIDRNPEALGMRIPHSTFHNLNINIPSVCCLVQAMKMRCLKFVFY